MPEEKPPRSFFHTVTKGVFLQKSSSTTSPTRPSAPRASAAARSPAPQGPSARSLADRIGTRETADLAESSSAASHRQPDIMSAGSSSRSHFEQSRGLHPRPPPSAAPASHSSKGKGRAPGKWEDSGLGDKPVASSSGGGNSRESRPSGGKDHYDVDLSEASQVADQAEKLVRLDKRFVVPSLYFWPCRRTDGRFGSRQRSTPQTLQALRPKGRRRRRRHPGHRSSQRPCFVDEGHPSHLQSGTRSVSRCTRIADRLKRS